VITNCNIGSTKQTHQESVEQDCGCADTVLIDNKPVHNHAALRRAFRPDHFGRNDK
jgi:hypothetical protein